MYGKLFPCTACMPCMVWTMHLCISIFSVCSVRPTPPKVHTIYPHRRQTNFHCEIPELCTTTNEEEKRNSNKTYKHTHKNRLTISRWTSYISLIYRANSYVNNLPTTTAIATTTAAVAVFFSFHLIFKYWISCYDCCWTNKMGHAYTHTHTFWIGLHRTSPVTELYNYLHRHRLVC